jgi:hypothetical protein
MKATSTLTITTCLLLFVLSNLPGALAQKKKFGKVEEIELKMDSFGQDTSAAAVILFDHGESRFTFNHEINVVFTRHIRIKILKKSGYDWANVDVPFYVKGSDREKVTNIKGYTFNIVDGKEQKDKLESKDIFEEQRSENWFAKKFTMPNVKEGSVLDISYTIHSDFYYTLRDWAFQTTIPTLWSEYQVEIPEYFDYKFMMQGYVAVDDANNSRSNNGPNMTNNKYSWVIKNVPALKEEKYITSLNDYQSKIEFELERVKFPGKAAQIMTGDWAEITKDLLMSDKFGTQLNRSGFFKDDLAKALADVKEPVKQMEAIYNLVKSKAKWNKKYSIYALTPIRKVYDTGSGNAAEINILLTSMLLEAGLDAAPVLVSTRSNGRIRTSMSPMVSKFNYVVTHIKIGDKEYILDATDPMLPMGMLPVRCLNGDGRLIKKNDQRWISLSPSSPYSNLFLADLTIDNTGEIVGSAKESAGGYNALLLRNSILEDGEAKYIEKITKEVGDYSIENPKFSNLNEINASLDLTLRLLVAVQLMI